MASIRVEHKRSNLDPEWKKVKMARKLAVIEKCKNK